MSIGKVSEFDVKTGVWSSYIERLDMYFTANEVKSERKLPTLIAVMGDGAYELLVNLASPSKPSELKYEEAIDLLAQHLQPAPSALAERYKYRQRRQGAEETIACYVAELKRMARFCKFGSNLSENLRDQFVCGLRSDAIRQRLFAEDDALTYNNAVKLATSLEAAERNAAVVDAAGTASIRGDSAAQFGDMHAMAVAGGERRSDASGGSWRGKGGARAQRGARGAALSAASTGGNMQGKRMLNGSRRACTGCGATSHGYETCRFREYECSRCRRKGHLRRVCPEQGAAGLADKKERTMHYANTEEPGEGQMTWEEEEDFHHLCLNDYRAVSLPISIENNTINMEVDTGTAVSCINSDTYKRFFRHIKLEKTSVRFKFYDGSVLKPLGIIKTKVKYAGVEKKLDLFVIEGGTTSLLGRQWLSELNIKLPLFSSCNKVDSVHFNNEIQLLLNRYKELFDGGLGRYTGGKATLRVRDGAVPVFHRARPLPYALRDRVDAELERMLRDGVIEPVDCSDWASPLVPVNKADGSLRICADYKATVNPVLLVDRYPLPKIDDVIVRMSGAQYFSKIDLSQAYNQIELDDTKKYTVINTHRGLYRYNRLVYGLASSPGIFQRTMCNLLSNIPNVEVFLDDVIIGGKSKEEHMRALETVFSRLHKKGLKLKTNKCVFLVKEVQYLGYILGKDGIKTDPRKLEAIAKIPRPTNVTQLRSFIGMINFYAKFIRNMSARLAPLYELLKKGKVWHWSRDCERAFNNIKNVLVSSEVLAHYDPDRPLILTCDASARGIGGVLTQPARDGRGERPIAYISRTLSDAEKNYSQIHREALAIIFCVNKFHQYLYGRRFVLRTDHKPLVSIFGPHTDIPTMVASRMQRWAIILSAYTYDIEYVKTNENGADGLSRLPVVISERKQMSHAVPEQTYLHFIQQALLLDYEEIRRQTGKDPLLSKILSYIRDGWPTECDITSLQPFFNRQKEIYEELGCVLWGHRLVVPENCKEKVLHMLHEPHMGIVKSKAMARSYVWWAGLDEAVERMCRACELCAAQADAPPRQAPCMWPWPNRAWSRLHLDFMGPIFGKTYLVTVDATSKWVEVFNMTSTTAGAVIDKLCELFSKFGLPKQVVSDNGPPFTSTEFHNFASNHGIEQIFTAPYHPASNGLAENAVKTFKRVIKKAALGKQNIERAIWTYLLHYRNTAHSTTGESPAMLLLGRRLRTKLDVLKPDRETTVAKSQKRQKEAAKGGHREVGPDEEVWYRQFGKGEKWVPGRVVQCVGTSNYKVRGSRGEIVHRHIDQIKRRSVRQSLISVPEIDQQVVANPGLDCGNEPSVLREGGQSAQSTDESGLRSPPPALEQGEVAEAVSPAAPPSPEFQDALPNVVSPQPRERLVRQCRIKNNHNYKV